MPSDRRIAKVGTKWQLVDVVSDEVSDRLVYRETVYQSSVDKLVRTGLLRETETHWAAEGPMYDITYGVYAQLTGLDGPHS